MTHAADTPPDPAATRTPRAAPAGAVRAHCAQQAWLGGLVKACHPGAVCAVTALSGLLAVSVGHEAGRVALVVAAVFCGQLSVGWSNDAVDAGRDAHVRRGDKPVAAGALAPATVWAAAWLALLACVPLSLACGVWAGVVHLVGVGAGWAYNLRLKSGLASPLPYAVGFASLPALVTLSGTDPRWPALWAVSTAALLGTAAHLTDALPDLREDLATGVRGVPHRLGATGTGVVSLALLVAATVVLVWGPSERPPALLWAAPVAAAALAATGLLLGRHRGKAPFVAAVLVATMDVALLALRGAQLS